MDKCRLLVRLLLLSIKARLAHSACFAAVALQEMMTAGRTIELRAVPCTAVRAGGHCRPTVDALLTDDSVALDAESGHPRLPIERDEFDDTDECHLPLESAWTSQLHASTMS